MFDDFIKRRPFVDPLLLVLRSRRVLIAVCALVIGLLTLAVPELEPVRGELLTLLITLALAIIGGYSVEDAAIAARRRDVHLDDADLRVLVREVVEALLADHHNQRS